MSGCSSLHYVATGRSSTVGILWTTWQLRLRVGPRGYPQVPAPTTSHPLALPKEPVPRALKKKGRTWESDEVKPWAKEAGGAGRGVLTERGRGECQLRVEKTGAQERAGVWAHWAPCSDASGLLCFAPGTGGKCWRNTLCRAGSWALCRGGVPLSLLPGIMLVSSSSSSS